MYSYFRTNTIAHIATLFLIALAIRLVVYFNGIPELIPSLKFMVLGEQIAHSKIMYEDIIDNVGVFSGLVFGTIHWIFGRSYQAYFWLGFLLTSFQLFYIVLLCHRKGFFLERNYVPGVVLIILLHLAPDTLFLSPTMLANSFLLLAFSGLINQIDKLNVSDDIFEAGLYIGIAYMFQPSVLPFIFWLFLVLNIHTGVKTRQILLVALGFLIPVVLVSSYYLYRNQWDSFRNYFLLSGLLRKNNELSYYKGLTYFVIPFTISILGFFVAIGAKGYNNFQTKVQQVLLWWVLIGSSTLFLMDFIAPAQMVIFVLPVLYFMMIFVNSFKQKWKSEIALTGSFIVCLFLFLQLFIPKINSSVLPNFGSLTVSQNDSKEFFGKKIAVLNQNWSHYNHSQSSLSLINWSLSKSYFTENSNYPKLVFIYNQFLKDKPEYIVDTNNVMENFLKKFPKLQSQYQLVEKGLYQKIN